MLSHQSWKERLIAQRHKRHDRRLRLRARNARMAHRTPTARRILLIHISEHMDPDPKRTPEDAHLDRKLMIEMLRRMLLIRAFETRLPTLSSQGLIRGS